MTDFNTAAAVMDALGGERNVAVLTDRTYKAVNNWRSFNKFPAVTYKVMQCELKKLGHTASSSLWGMIECKK